MPDLSGLRILADEDVSLKLIRPLRSLGVDIITGPKGLKNGKLFKFSVKNSRIFLTHDEDFSNNFLYPVSKTSGIIMMKIHPAIETELLQALKKLFDEVSPKAIQGKRVRLFKTGYEIE